MPADSSSDSGTGTYSRQEAAPGQQRHEQEQERHHHQQHQRAGPSAHAVHHLRGQPMGALANIAINLCEESLARASSSVHAVLHGGAWEDRATQEAAVAEAEAALAHTLRRLQLARRLAAAALRHAATAMGQQPAQGGGGAEVRDADEATSPLRPPQGGEGGSGEA